MTATQYKMNHCELWASITLNAAHAFGLKVIALIEFLTPVVKIYFFNGEY